jgi:hypothetical protein
LIELGDGLWVKGGTGTLVESQVVGNVEQTVMSGSLAGPDFCGRF